MPPEQLSLHSCSADRLPLGGGQGLFEQQEVKRGKLCLVWFVLSFGEHSDLLIFALLRFVSGNVFANNKQAPDCSCFAEVVSLYFHCSPTSPIFHHISFVVCLFYAILHRSQLNHYLSFKGKIENLYLLLCKL